MIEHYPKIRLYQTFDDEQYLRIRESVRVCFYMRRPHREINHEVLRSLEVYRQAIGDQRLAWYPDDQGDWQELDAKNWELQRAEMLDPRGCTIWLDETPNSVTGYKFTYRGWPLEALPFNRDPGVVCMVSFWLPTEFLEAQGPARVRELALELGKRLPFSSGHAGLCFQFPEQVLGYTEHLRDLCFRYPGLDMPMTESIHLNLGLRINGVHWLTFLGQPVLGRLGGAAGLLDRLHAPGVTVQELEAGRAVVTLGEWPEAGDLEKGQTLPAYRELAHVLKRWRYRLRKRYWSGFTEEDTRKWDRRFLE
ncbi:MAG TPA: DUF3396 domain-containing protein [Myxococcaceae bacterium]|jgi:hypothetical protein